MKNEVLAMSRGLLFVVSAPSGTGKTTLLQKTMESLANLEFSVSHTTREPRPGEQDGRDYHFVSSTVFQKMQAEGCFVESATVHGSMYGTSAAALAAQQDQGRDVLLDIDVQGAAILRSSGLDAVHIFVAPPDMKVLEQRLRNRHTESEEKIALRLDNAREEMAAANLYEYVLVNDDLVEAVTAFSAIIIAERARHRRNARGETLTLGV